MVYPNIPSAAFDDALSSASVFLSTLFLSGGLGKSLERLAHL